jgi:hypothetical protein
MRFQTGIPEEVLEKRLMVAVFRDSISDYLSGE